MFATLKSAARAATGAGLALAGLAALPTAVLAEGEATKAAAPVSTSASMIAVRDAVTGQLRAATAEEAQALQAAKSPRGEAATARTMPKVHSSGAQGVRLTDEFATYSVAVRRTDGTLAHQNFDTRAAAEAAAKDAKVAPAPTPAPTE